MRFEAAWVWFLAPPLLAYLWWLMRRSYAQLTPGARRGSFAIRIAIMLLLLAAVSRPALLVESSTNHVVFVLDASQSVRGENLDAALEQVDTLAREAFAKRSDTRISLVAYGQSASLLVGGQAHWDGLSPELREKLTYAKSLTSLYEEQTKLISAGAAESDGGLRTLKDRIASIERFQDDVAGSFTDIERALRLALNCGPSDERRAVYLLTDANFNRGRWQSAFAAAESARTPIHVVILDRPSPPEVAVADLQLPASVRVDQGFTADVRIASTIETDAELRIFKDGYLQQESKIKLRPGDNVFKAPGLYFHDKGFHAIEASVKASQDTQLANNHTRSIVVVPGEARVLYIDRDVEQIPYLKGALELEGIQVEARSAAGVPQNLSELLSFDAFILCNVPADRMSMRQMQMIRSYVQDFGGGFLMLGGDESFGLGGYFGTPIEEILPVKMPIQKDLLRPSLALMLVIDKSGSMDGVKIQIAKRAALATADAINPRDLIGVIGFDGEARVLLELTPAADHATVASHIAALDAGGGTFLYPALHEAHERLASSNARRKHVIVLSDGQTQGFGYEDQVAAMGSDSITLSAVGIGDGADMNLMETIATAGNGRAYFTNDYNTIPQIFTREALRASRSMLVEKIVQPTAIAHDPALEEIDTDELPVLTGYVATTPRPAASTLIVSDSGDPILAKWRYGLGRTAAFTSEPKPRWAEDWVEWDDFAKFWSQLVRSLTGQDLRQTVYVETTHRVDGSDAILTADVRNAAGDFVDDVELELTTVTPAGRPRALPVSRAGPGLHEGRFADFKYGEDQQFVWRVRSGRNTATQPTPSQPAAADSAEQSSSYGFVYSFSPEFATLGAATDTIEQLRTRDFGTVVSVGQAKFIENPATSHRSTSLWPYLLMAALLLTPIDILIRRLG